MQDPRSTTMHMQILLIVRILSSSSVALDSTTSRAIEARNVLNVRAPPGGGRITISGPKPLSGPKKPQTGPKTPPKKPGKPSKPTGPGRPKSPGEPDSSSGEEEEEGVTVNPRIKKNGVGSEGQYDNEGVICKRGGEACSGYWEPSYYGEDPDEEGHNTPAPIVYKRPDGTHRPLERMNPEEKAAMVADAKREGKATIDTVDGYVDSGKSRLSELPEGQRPKEITESYDVKDTENADLDTMPGGIIGPFKRSGVPVKGSVGFTKYKISSKTLTKDRQEQNLPKKAAVVMGYNGETLITMQMYPKEDGTPGAGPERLRVSELTYQGVPGMLKGMKRNEQNHVNNQQSVNYMAVVHESYPDNISQIPDDGKGKSLGAQAGHGKFVPGDEGFVMMSNSPNVKLIWNIIADHAPDMENNYIVEIHTEPAVDSETHPNADAEHYRPASIVLILGKKPGKE